MRWDPFDQMIIHRHRAGGELEMGMFKHLSALSGLVSTLFP